MFCSNMYQFQTFLNLLISLLLYLAILQKGHHKHTLLINLPYYKTQYIFSNAENYKSTNNCFQNTQLDIRDCGKMDIYQDLRIQCRDLEDACEHYDTQDSMFHSHIFTVQLNLTKFQLYMLYSLLNQEDLIIDISMVQILQEYLINHHHW